MRAKIRARAKALLCLIPPVRGWFAEVDQLATDARLWRSARSRVISGEACDQEAIRTLMAYLTPRHVFGIAKIRIGERGDGGYVMLDDFSDVTGAFSLGIGPNCSWDMQIAERGIDVYQYDHTVDGPPVDHPRFHFIRKMIAPVASTEAESLSTALYAAGAVGNRLILKIDIEGAEWEVFDSTPESVLSGFAQIIAEFHDFHQILNPTWRERAQRVFAKLRSQFDVVHVHANNYGTYDIVANIPVPEVLEVSWVNRTLYRTKDASEVFPTAIDQPNRPDRPEIFLGAMRYR